MISLALESYHILAGDIGGTKTDLGLFKVEGGLLGPVKGKRYVNGDYEEPEEVIEEFLSGTGVGLSAASFGVAALVDGNRAELTNIAWTLDGTAIKKRFGIERVELINDLVATGWGVGLLGSADLVPLQKGISRNGNAALIAAGTGLGETILFWDGTTHIPSASEGGHADFAPRGPVEAGLLEYLAGRFDHVSFERVLSGTGLKNIYDYLIESKGLSVDGKLGARFKKEDPASVITDEARKGSDATCREALKHFVSIYGGEAGNLALTALATAGVYVGGGIAPKIVKELGGWGFIEAFSDKGRFREFLSEVPVYVILNAKTALLGAAHHAARSVSDREYRLA